MGRIVGMEAMDTRKAIYWRGRLRSARNSALGDSEGFLPIVECMERMGNQLAAELGKDPPGGLSKKLKITIRRRSIHAGAHLVRAPGEFQQGQSSSTHWRR